MRASPLSERRGKWFEQTRTQLFAGDPAYEMLGKVSHVRNLETNTFLLLVVLASLAFGWLLWPVSGAILWGTGLAILFGPLHRQLSGQSGLRPTFAALLTILIITLIGLQDKNLFGWSLGMLTVSQ